MVAYSGTMRVRVLYFGVLQDLVAESSAAMEVAEGLSVGELVALHRDLAGAAVWDSVAVAVNQVYGRADDVLHEGDEVAMLPPVSGGSTYAG